jgi:PAS domain S-box-containing protein
LVSTELKRKSNVDVLIAHLKRFSEYWAVLVGIIAFAAGWYRFGRKHSLRLLRSVDLSDHLHERFGHKKARDLATEIHGNHIDAAVREVRVTLLERRTSASVYVCDAVTGECTYANAELAELFGMDATDFAGRGWTDAIVAGERAEVFAVWQNAVKEHLPYECEYNVLNRRSNEVFRVYTRAYPAKLKSGKIVWYVGTVERVE